MKTEFTRWFRSEAEALSHAGRYNAVVSGDKIEMVTDSQKRSRNPLRTAKPWSAKFRHIK